MRTQASRRAALSVQPAPLNLLTPSLNSTNRTRRNTLLCGGCELRELGSLYRCESSVRFSFTFRSLQRLCRSIQARWCWLRKRWRSRKSPACLPLAPDQRPVTADAATFSSHLGTGAYEASPAVRRAPRPAARRGARIMLAATWSHRAFHDSTPGAAKATCPRLCRRRCPAATSVAQLSKGVS